jgi:hypothetical protein
MGKWMGGGNVVDTEALRWLASQPGPRVWICDGFVTGMMDHEGMNITRECGILATRARVKRFQSIEEYLASTVMTARAFEESPYSERKYAGSTVVFGDDAEDDDEADEGEY